MRMLSRLGRPFPAPYTGQLARAGGGAMGGAGVPPARAPGACASPVRNFERNPLGTRSAGSGQLPAPGTGRGRTVRRGGEAAAPLPRNCGTEPMAAGSGARAFVAVRPSLAGRGTSAPAERGGAPAAHRAACGRGAALRNGANGRGKWVVRAAASPRTAAAAAAARPSPAGRGSAAQRSGEGPRRRIAPPAVEGRRCETEPMAAGTGPRSGNAKRSHWSQEFQANPMAAKPLMQCLNLCPLRPLRPLR
jgi:hypothetical protein